MNAPTLAWRAGRNDAITDVPGVTVGHFTDRKAATGCTVILAPTTIFAAVDVRGGAPGTRETDVLSPANIVRRCHAILLTGGSAFGLAAASGVVRYLAERGVGFETSAGPVPIVPGAVIFDLGIGQPGAFPGEAEGYRAALRAKSGRVAQGSIGAGTGATVAKLLGEAGRLKGGFGTASLVTPRGLIVGAVAVTNAVGNIIDPATGALVAGPLLNGRMLAVAEALATRTAEMDAFIENTTLVCVATNATLDHHAVQRLAYQAHDGMARAISPVHTFGDGDVAFALTTGQLEARPEDSMLAGAMAAAAVELAILASVRMARPLGGVPAVSSVARMAHDLVTSPGQPAGAAKG